MPNTTSNVEPIDAVITWVDGSDPDHKKQLKLYMEAEEAALGENATNPHRWGSDVEIIYCLRSIANHAPWFRTIWIVTNGQKPDLSGLPEHLISKIRYCFHEQIFAGIEDALPTFNSTSIETVFWRIPDLAERFVYFNDDVFLTAKAKPSDWFDEDKTVLRGKWVDRSKLLRKPHKLEHPKRYVSAIEIRAANLLTCPVVKIFSAAHVAHPFRVSILRNLFDQYTASFEANAKYRFRSLEQFGLQALFNLHIINQDRAMFADRKVALHIKSGQGSRGTADEMRSHLRGALTEKTKFLCVNDLPQLEALVPDIRDWIESAIADR